MKPNHTEAIARAADIVGGQASLARALGITPPTVSQWVGGGRPIPLERCPHIEQLTNGEIRRWDLRPDDWFLIWPELINVKGAPDVPVKAEA